MAKNENGEAEPYMKNLPGIPGFPGFLSFGKLLPIVLLPESEMSSLNLELHETSLPQNYEIMIEKLQNEICFFSIFIFGQRTNINIFIKLYLVWGRTVF